jgi:hypothetical protein
MWTYQLNWDHVFHQTRNPDPTRLFFMNHQYIHTLNLMQSYESPAVVDPKAMQELFPALRHFTGWAFMCIAVVRSDLRLQLESLSIRGP